MPSGLIVPFILILQLQDTLVCVHGQPAVEAHHGNLVCDAGFPHQVFCLLIRIGMSRLLNLCGIVRHRQRTVHAHCVLVHGILPEQRRGIYAQFVPDNLILNPLLQKLYIVHLELLFQIIRDGLLGSIPECVQNEIGNQLGNLIFILIHPFCAVLHHSGHQLIQCLLEIQFTHFRVKTFLDIGHR